MKNLSLSLFKNGIQKVDNNSLAKVGKYAIEIELFSNHVFENGVSDISGIVYYLM